MTAVEDVYSVPFKIRKGRWSRVDTWRETGDGGCGREERMVDIYCTMNAPMSTTQAQQREPPEKSLETSDKRSAPANLQKRNPLKTAYSWCLALVCLLLLAALIGLAIHHFAVSGQNSELRSTLDKVQQERNTLLKQQDALRRNLTGNICACWPNTSCSCYYISSVPKTWEESKDDCVERGDHLVIINSQEEQEFLKQYSSHWVGLTDEENEGSWKWVDGSPVTTTYWGNYQPDNKGNDPNTEEDCAVIASGGWNDMWCLKYNSWICERNVDL